MMAFVACFVSFFFLPKVKSPIYECFGFFRICDAVALRNPRGFCAYKMHSGIVAF